MDHPFNSTTHVVQSNTCLASIYYNIKTIIDDRLLYSNRIPTSSHYFSCVVQVFTKYRLSFKLSKCDLFLPRVEYIGHDCTVGGNYPVQFNFKLIKIWSLPPHDVSLLSFIGLCDFYRNYVPWFESNIKPLCRLQRLYDRQSLPMLAWSPRSSSYSNNTKTTSLHHLFSCDMIVQIQPF